MNMKKIGGVFVVASLLLSGCASQESGTASDGATVICDELANQLDSFTNYVTETMTTGINVSATLDQQKFANILESNAPEKALPAVKKFLSVHNQVVNAISNQEAEVTIDSSAYKEGAAELLSFCNQAN